MCDLSLLGSDCQLCKELGDRIRMLDYCDELIPGCMSDIIIGSRQAFKDHSQRGGVWQKKKYYDIGNFAYAVLYNLLMGEALLQNGLSPEMTFYRYGQLVNKYESLDVNHCNWEIKADVIECFLATSAETGLMVHSDDKKQRTIFMDFMRFYKDWFQRFLRRLTNCGRLTDGPPLVRHIPGLHETVACIRSQTR